MDQSVPQLVLDSMQARCDFSWDVLSVRVGIRAYTMLLCSRCHTDDGEWILGAGSLLNIPEGLAACGAPGTPLRVFVNSFVKSHSGCFLVIETPASSMLLTPTHTTYRCYFAFMHSHAAAALPSNCFFSVGVKVAELSAPILTACRSVILAYV